MRAEGSLSASVPVIGIVKAPLASEEEEAVTLTLGVVLGPSPITLTLTLTLGASRQRGGGGGVPSQRLASLDDRSGSLPPRLLQLYTDRALRRRGPSGKGQG